MTDESAVEDSEELACGRAGFTLSRTVVGTEVRGVGAQRWASWEWF